MPPTFRSTTFALAALAGPALAACSGGGSSGAGSSSGAPATVEAGAPAPALTEFVAQAQTFDGFCAWHSAVATPSGTVPLGVHGTEPMNVYWKASPPHGSTQFPVGTVVLKETTEADAGARLVFAMVKRTAHGGDYNMTGADGWEWFSLEDNGDCTASILWRGPQAPIVTTYTDLHIGDCNGCHEMAVANDYVWDTALQLTAF